MSLSQEKREEYLQKARERSKKRYQNMTLEQKQEYARNNYANRKKRSLKRTTINS